MLTGEPPTVSSLPSLVTAAVRPLPKTVRPPMRWIHDRWCTPSMSTYSRLSLNVLRSPVVRPSAVWFCLTNLSATFLAGSWLLLVRKPSRRASIRTVPVVPSMSKTARPGSACWNARTGPRSATWPARRAAMARAVLDCPWRES